MYLEFTFQEDEKHKVKGALFPLIITFNCKDSVYLIVRDLFSLHRNNSWELAGVYSLPDLPLAYLNTSINKIKDHLGHMFYYQL